MAGTARSMAFLRGDERSVLVFRALQVGDLLCALPALRVLRRQLPAAQIVLVGLPWAAQLLPRFASLIDACLPFPGHPGLPERVPDPLAYPSFLAQVRALRADVAIQLHGSGERTNPIVATFGARRMAGFAQRTGSRCLRWPDQGHEIERCLSLVRALCDGEGIQGKQRGADDDSPGTGAAARMPACTRESDLALEFPIVAADLAELAATDLPDWLRGCRYACLHPGARSAQRRWPVERFAQVGDALAAAGLTVVLTGSADEWSLAEQVRQRMQSPARNAALPISLGALAALLRDACLLVCNDTGVSHLACALRVPSVVVFVSSDPARWAPLDRSRHRVVLDPAGRRPEDVLECAWQLLGKTGGHV